MTAGPKSIARAGLVFWALTIYAGLMCAFLLAPIIVAVILSFSSAEHLDFPPPGFSMRWYAAAFEIEHLGSGLWISTVIATATAIISAVGGTTAAIAINHYRFRGRAAVQNFVMLPLSIPGIVIGLAILATAATVLGHGPGIGLTIAGHSVLGVPYVTYLVLATLSNYDMTLEQASTNLGASPWITFRRITLPLVAPGIIAGGIVAFLISFDNIALSIFLSRGDTFPLRLMQQIQFYVNPSIAAVSTMLVAASLVVMIVLGLLLRSNRSFRYQG